jgi:hypothetical protein
MSQRKSDLGIPPPYTWLNPSTRPSFWLAADATYYLGGRTNLDGVAGHDFQSVTRAGFTLSIPLGDGFSAKVSFGGWLTAQNAGAFDRIGVTLQYRWFDR